MPELVIKSGFIWTERREGFLQNIKIKSERDDMLIGIKMRIGLNQE